VKIGLVACGARKLSHPAPARELYAGMLFRLASAYAERACDEWYILSGKHGLVLPDEVLAPYDSAFPRMPAKWRWAWAVGVLDTLDRLGLNEDGTRWLILAGERFRQFLVPGLRGMVEVPLAGLGIGEQIAWLKRML